MSHPVNTDLVEMLIRQLYDICSDLKNMGIEKEKIIEAIKEIM